MFPVIFKDILPSPVLQEQVRKYQVFRFVFDKDIVPPVKFHAPRPEHSITFYLRDPQKFSFCNTGNIVTYPSCIINGMYTVPILRYGGSDFWAIKVVLQPTTLFQLLKTHLREFTNSFINAEDVFGNVVLRVREQLRESENLNEMIIVIEEFLKRVMKKNSKPDHPFDKAICLTMNMENAVSIKWLTNQSCMSTRHFIRKFEERIGISAKTFQRIARFDKTFRSKNAHPELNWKSIAFEKGYYDYQHLVRDFKEFTFHAPPAFYEIDKKSPERYFGLFER